MCCDCYRLSPCRSFDPTLFIQSDDLANLTTTNNNTAPCNTTSDATCNATSQGTNDTMPTDGGGGGGGGTAAPPVIAVGASALQQVADMVAFDGALYVTADGGDGAGVELWR